MRTAFGMRRLMGRGTVRRMDGGRRLPMWRHLPVLRRVVLVGMSLGRAAGDDGGGGGMRGRMMLGLAARSDRAAVGERGGVRRRCDRRAAVIDGGAEVAIA